MIWKYIVNLSFQRYKSHWLVSVISPLYLWVSFYISDSVSYISDCQKGENAKTAFCSFWLLSAARARHRLISSSAPGKSRKCAESVFNFFSFVALFGFFLDWVSLLCCLQRSQWSLATGYLTYTVLLLLSESQYTPYWPIGKVPTHPAEFISHLYLRA